MSSKKTTGNRWATAVEGAADILLDTGKASGVEPSVLIDEVQPQGPHTPATKPAKKTRKTIATDREESISKEPLQLKKPDSSSPPSSDVAEPLMQPASSTTKQRDPAPSSSVDSVSVAANSLYIDPIQQALTMKGRKSSGGRQRTYYIDNDVADKITSLAKELDKSESQLLREVLRAVFKMNE